MRAPCLLLLLLAPAALAQDRAAEVRQLEDMLRRVDAALVELGPLCEPETSLAQYDVRHLMYRPLDRAAPSLWVPSEAAGFRTARGGGGGGAVIPAGGVLSFDEEDEYSEGVLLDQDQLETVIVNTVGEDEWDDPRSIELHRGYVFVRQTAVGHARIRRLLGDLSRRAVQGVQLEVGFYALPPALEEEVRTGALGTEGVLAPEVLARLDAAVADGGAKLTGSATLTSLDGQRIYLHQGTERAYLADFERSSGGTGKVMEAVPDPIVEVLRAGLALDVRATVIEGDDARIALDVRFARSRVLKFEQRQTPWGAMAMPQVTMDSVRTSAQVPGGAGMLVFGARGTEDDGTQDVVIVVRPRLIGGP